MRSALAVPLLLWAVTAGCGGQETVAEESVRPEVLPGERVGALAEARLEVEHPRMATGSVTCPDLAWKVGASVRCVKVSELSEGRRVQILGTVTVTSTDGGGRLHVELDDQAAEFGIAAEHLSAEATAWVRDQTTVATEVECPYLPGALGASVTCLATVAGNERALVARVTSVDGAEYRTGVAFDWAGAAPVGKASPTFVAGR